jgi:hypothetical protein
MQASKDLDHGNGALQAAQLRALVTIAHAQLDLWQQLSQDFALAAVARADGMDTPDLPCSPRIYETAKLLATAPGLWEIISGATPKWTNKTPVILAMAEWSRQHAKALGRLTAHAQRIHGLQFTAKTPAVKCAHRLLQMMGLDVQCLGREGSGGREWQYRLVMPSDITAKLTAAEDLSHFSES